MADATTTNYSWTKPEVGASEDTWGTKLNANWDGVDALLGGVSATEFAYLDGSLPNTVVNSKAVVYGSAGEASANEVNLLEQGSVRLQDATGGEFAAIRAPSAIPSSYTLTLPTADGADGQFLKTDGSGGLSFDAAGGGLTGVTVFTSSGTFTIPDGVTTLKVTVLGGGGGGSDGDNNGSTGGDSIVASGTETITTVTGKGGGRGSGGSISEANPGDGIGGDVNIKGQIGESAGVGDFSLSGAGGSSMFGFGGPSITDSSGNGNNATGFGAGGSGSSDQSTKTGGGGAGAGAAIKYLSDVTPGNTLTVTVGAGGAGASGASIYTAGSGSAGIVIFEY